MFKGEFRKKMKTESINLKVLPEYKDALQALAMVDAESLSVVMRRLIREAALSEGLWPHVTSEKPPSISKAKKKKCMANHKIDKSKQVNAHRWQQ